MKSACRHGSADLGSLTKARKFQRREDKIPAPHFLCEDGNSRQKEFHAKAQSRKDAKKKSELRIGASAPFNTPNAMRLAAQ
jgi:hypothetical protein